MGAAEVQKNFAHVPFCTIDKLGAADTVIFSPPTHFGNMCNQMHQHLDATATFGLRPPDRQGQQCFTSSATQPSGEEPTILKFGQ